MSIIEKPTVNKVNGVITLKEITDLITVEHNKAMKVVERLCLELSFGTVEKIDVIYNNKNQTIKTFLLKEHQAERVKNILSYNKVKNIKSNVLYLITDGKFTKIGIATKNATSRLKQCQTGNPKKLWIDFEIEINNAFEFEQKLHRKFKDKRLEGEWFNLSRKQREDIKKSLGAK